MSRKSSIYFCFQHTVQRTFIFLLVLALTLSGNQRGGLAAGSILYVKPGGAGDCSAWSRACELQTALTKSVSGNQVWVAAGRYVPSTNGDRSATFQLKGGVAVYGGFSGTEGSLSQRDWTANVVTLSGDLKGDDSGFTNNGENSYHIVTAATGATLDGVVIQGGNADGSDQNGSGGGMLNLNNSSPTLNNIHFVGNKALYFGGGMFNYSLSSPTLTNVIFNGNAANTGGGMCNEYGSNPSLTNVTFQGNRGQDLSGSGGGMANLYSSPALSNVIFSANTAIDYGGGMFNAVSSPTLANVTFTDNTGSNGGGMYNTGDSSPSLVDVTFRENQANQGGGMFNWESSPGLVNITLEGNTATYGGGMFNYSSSPMLTNVTFSANMAEGDGVLYFGNGGGMYNEGSSPTLTHVTFNSNQSDHGGAIYSTNNSHPMVSNSILWGDSGGEIYNGNNSAPTVSSSDVQGGYPGTGNLDMNPLLATLGNYGGSIKTVPLLPGSPAINATSSSCSSTDARGVARSSPACDLGAFESQGFDPLSPVSGDNQNTPIQTLFPQPLCVAVVAIDPTEPVDGGKVTFTPPTGGASASLTSNPATVANGSACTNAQANGIEGTYTVTASAAGAASAIFSLTNGIPVEIDIPITGLLATNNGPTTFGTAAVFTATVTTGTNVSYTWDFGDHTTGAGGVVAHLYSTPGTYTATVTAHNTASLVTASTNVTVLVKLYLPCIKHSPEPVFQPRLRYHS